MTEIQEKLFALRDEPYGDFLAALLPGVERERVIGVRAPAVRALAKELCGGEAAEAFLLALPHRYHEENMLHAALLDRERDCARCLAALERFLPCVDNWAVCDTLRPKVFKKHTRELLERVPLWLVSEQNYTVRFGIGALCSFCLDEAFDPEQLAWVAALRSGEYYVNMMIAWYFATALAKQYGAALPYLEQRRLEPWTHNKTIQKAVESFRVPEEHKNYLKTLRRKKDE